MAESRITKAAPVRDQGGGMFTVVSVAVLVGTEILGAALAAGWALAGIFELGPPFDYALMGLFALAALWMLTMFVRSAVRVERSGQHA